VPPWNSAAVKFDHEFALVRLFWIVSRRGATGVAYRY
jgi:hypothetical protein